QAEFVGSKMSKALDAIASAARAPKAKVQITTASETTNGLSVQAQVTEIPATNAGEPVEIILAITESDLQSNVSRGENAGRRLNHGTVVRQLKVIGSGKVGQSEMLSGKSAVNIEKGWRREHLRAVVFIQEPKSRKIIGAAAVKLAQAGAQSS